MCSSWLSGGRSIKNSIRALASNLLNFGDKQLKTDAKHIKVLKELRLKYAILKPDKGNGVVLIKIADYILSMTQLFSDKINLGRFTLILL